MENKYKTISFYDVRKVVFVHGTELSPLAAEFIENEGGIKNLYLQIRSFFRPNPLADPTLYCREFDVAVYYDLSELELWYTFNCGNGLYYYFNHEWVNYQNAINFNVISAGDQQEVKEHCIKINAERYRNIPFGNELYDILGQEFTEDLLPRLYNLSQTINGPMPAPIRFLSRILSTMIVLGIIIPFMVTMGLIGQWSATITVSAVLSLLLYLALTFHKTLSSESKIT